MVSQSSRRDRRRALDRRKIFFRYIFPVLLERRLDAFVPREQHQAGGFAIESMDDKSLLRQRLCQRLEVLIQNAMRGALLLAGGAYREQSGRFVNYNDRLVEVDNFDSVQRDFGGSSLPGRDRHQVTGFKLRIVTNSPPVPHGHCAESQQLFRFCAREPGRWAEQPGQKLASRLDAKLLVRCQKIRQSNHLRGGRQG